MVCLKKNGQALPLNTIVIAILVMIVLVVVIVMFSNSMGDTNDTLSGCELKSGICVMSSSCGKSMNLNAECANEQEICCSKPLRKEFKVEYEMVD